MALGQTVGGTGLTAGTGGKQGNVTVELIGIKDVVNALKSLTDGRTRTALKKLFRAGPAKMVIEAERKFIKAGSTYPGWKIYRGGKYEGATTKGQLAKSIGIIKAKNQGPYKMNPNILVGARLYGQDTITKGGWYGHMFAYGVPSKSIQPWRYEQMALKATSQFVEKSIKDGYMNINKKNVKKHNMQSTLEFK